MCVCVARFCLLGFRLDILACSSVVSFALGLALRARLAYASTAFGLAFGVAHRSFVLRVGFASVAHRLRMFRIGVIAAPRLGSSPSRAKGARCSVSVWRFRSRPGSSPGEAYGLISAFGLGGRAGLLSRGDWASFLDSGWLGSHQPSRCDLDSFPDSG